MTTTPALQWLDAEFSKITKRFARDFRAGPSSKSWHGPSYIRPMIQLRSVMDGGTAMRVCADDYGDPDRWWL
jgi:hypothetical protein